MPVPNPRHPNPQHPNRSPDVPEVLLATGNPHKLDEVRAVLAPLGWTVLGLGLHTGALSVSWSGNHTQAPAATLPLLVLDMYQHAYALDHGAAAARYVDAFFANVRWDVVDHRLARAQKAKAALSV